MILVAWFLLITLLEGFGPVSGFQASFILFISYLCVSRSAIRDFLLTVSAHELLSDVLWELLPHHKNINDVFAIFLMFTAYSIYKYNIKWSRH